MRRPFVAGNWKMNMDLASARTLIQTLQLQVGASPLIDLAICPPSVFLHPVRAMLGESSIRLGAQNCCSEPQGAFTGEVSAAMVKEVGCRCVILGHSERRHTIGPKDASGCVQGETDAMVAAKAKAVLAQGLIPIVCVGETLAQRDRGETEAVLARQIAGSLAGIELTSGRQLVIAYEPVWAIGTGRTATPEQAQAAHQHIRALLAAKMGAVISGDIRIQYGGSVKPSNAEVLMRNPDVDGALVGGASLNADDFLGIIRGCIKGKSLD